MHADSKQDSTTYPHADYAKLLIDQVIISIRNILILPNECGYI